MVRWVAFAGVVSVLVTLLLALTRSSAAAVRETGSGDDRTGEESDLTRVRGSLGDSDEGGLLGDSDKSGLFGDSDERGLLSPLPWRSADDPENPLSGPGGTELTTLDESDYPEPPPEHARPDEPTTESRRTRTRRRGSRQSTTRFRRAASRWTGRVVVIVGTGLPTTGTGGRRPTTLPRIGGVSVRLTTPTR